MRAIGIVLAGGNSKRMRELSNKRAIAAMPIAGSYRSVDFALSNMSNSHIQSVAVLTQYNSRSLNEHLSSSKWWDFGRKQGGMYVFTPTITAESSDWYRGTADALYQNLDFLKKSHEPYVVLASGDGIYKLDYNKVLEYHIEKKADITVVRKAIEINNPNPTDGIEVLAKVGGFDIGGMTGVILGCAANRIPVVVDGFISYAAALIAYRINPRSKDYLIMSHKSDEKGSETALSILGIKPMLDMDMRLGEGTGAALAMNIIDSSIYAYNHMGEFKDLEIGRVLGLWDK